MFVDDWLYKTVLVLTIALMIVGTLVGNALVCLAVLLVRKLKQPPNILLVSLAIADFSVGLFVMPIAALPLLFEQRWLLGRVVCILWTSADLTLCTASILNLCMISVDRYLAINRPLTYGVQRTTRRILAYVAIVWIVALLVSVAPLVIVPLPRTVSTCQVSVDSQSRHSYV